MKDLTFIQKQSGVFQELNGVPVLPANQIYDYNLQKTQQELNSGFLTKKEFSNFLEVLNGKFGYTAQNGLTFAPTIAPNEEVNVISEDIGTAIATKAPYSNIINISVGAYAANPTISPSATVEEIESLNFATEIPPSDYPIEASRWVSAAPTSAAGYWGDRQTVTFTVPYQVPSGGSSQHLDYQYLDYILVTLDKEIRELQGYTAYDVAALITPSPSPSQFRLYTGLVGMGKSYIVKLQDGGEFDIHIQTQQPAATESAENPSSTATIPATEGATQAPGRGVSTNNNNNSDVENYLDSLLEQQGL